MHTAACGLIVNTDCGLKVENIERLDVAISATVRALRAKTGLSQDHFADLAGLSRVYIAQLETGERGASLNALLLVARSVGLTGAELVAMIEKELEPRHTA